MKDRFSIKIEGRIKRATRTRAKIFGTAKKPRLSIFRSNKHIYIQAIDDANEQTLASASDLELKDRVKKSKLEVASLVGLLIAKKTGALKVKEAVFDRGGYKYHGIVKAAAEGARQGGLEF